MFVKYHVNIINKVMLIFCIYFIVTYSVCVCLCLYIYITELSCVIQMDFIIYISLLLSFNTSSDGRMSNSLLYYKITLLNYSLFSEFFLYTSKQMILPQSQKSSLQIHDPIGVH